MWHAGRVNAARPSPDDPDEAVQSQPLRAEWHPRANPAGSTSHNTGTKTKTPRTRLGRVLAGYGWWVYALPAMLALTAFVVVNTVTAAGESAGGAVSGSDGGSGGGLGGEQPGKPLASEHRSDPVPLDIPTAELPAGGEYAQKGAGTWQVVPGTSKQVGSGEPVLTYTVEVEDGVDSSSYAGNKAFAQTVEAILSDPRGWTGSGEVSFKRVDGDAADPDFRVSLTTPETTHKAGVCGHAIEYESSCYNSNLHRVVINLARWVRGAMAFQGDLGLYRQYVINHEVGHALGNTHVGCPKDGALAPLMMQQTFGVANDYVAKLNGAGGPVPANGKVCRPNAWPNPAARPDK